MDFLQLEMVSPSVCIPRGCDSGVVAGHDIGAAGQLHSVHLVPRGALVGALLGLAQASLGVHKWVLAWAWGN